MDLETLAGLSWFFPLPRAFGHIAEEIREFREIGRAWYESGECWGLFVAGVALRWVGCCWFFHRRCVSGVLFVSRSFVGWFRSFIGRFRRFVGRFRRFVSGLWRLVGRFRCFVGRFRHFVGRLWSLVSRFRGLVG